MQQQLAQLVAAATQEASAVATRAELEAFKARVVGPNGSLTQVMKGMATLSKEERPVVGKLINEAKKSVEELLAALLTKVENAEIAAALGASVDPTLPSPDAPAGSLHPLSRTRERILASFRKLGFVVADGPEVETEWHCFDALNTPADHPARDMQDTLYMPKAFRSADAPRKADEAILLRTHTSSVQVRTMLSRKPPFRIVAPGRCFRRDAVDATHSANFHQVEGLWIDRNVTLADLRGVLDFFVKETFGADAEIRLRPSFFPFTEPSFEMDLRSPNLGRLSDRWLEIMGCGLVDPKVLELCGLDPQEWSGLAFGLGLERIAMLVHGIDDIRHFYNNDTRFLRQFA
ncbi:MAG: phenylalanyl-tRNA synthase subunit alpha [Verrucomicrobiota bacterium]|jgi:phenylalanyl-tRNA synthetase alpha chain